MQTIQTTGPAGADAATAAARAEVATAASGGAPTSAPAPEPIVALDHLRELEAEAVHIMREVVAELERPVLLFSGGKDSIVLLRLAEKAFGVGEGVGLPFPVLHVDTGHNFDEV